MRLFWVFVLSVWMTAPALAQDRLDRVALQAALIAVRDGDWVEAADHATSHDPVIQSIVDWHKLRADGTYPEVAAFLQAHPDWPGLALMRRRVEEDVPAESAMSFFADAPPQTGAGVLTHVEALREDAPDQADAALITAWTTMQMPQETERLYLRNHGTLLRPHHAARLDMLLWQSQRSDARRMVPFVSDDQAALAEARIALQSNASDVEAKLSAVPEALKRHGGLAFDRFQWRTRKGLNEGALELLLGHSLSAEALGNPQAWSNRRRSIARDMMRDEQNRTAYHVASTHFLTEGSNFADLEWLSGFIALRKLNQPEVALTHFTAFEAAVKTPISKGRAFYWLGRTHGALGDAEAAQAAYAEGGRHQTSFYGLLAAEKAGLPLDPSLVGFDTPWEDARFTANPVFQAADLFISIGEDALAERFLTHLADILPTDELRALGSFAVAKDRPHIAVMIGKRAARRGIVIPQAYFALHPLADMDLPAPKALSLAIARRESEFDPVVTSSAGALGLMQVMPRTAQAVARDQGMVFRSARLLSDWQYNARLGSAYLADLIEDFGDSPVMVAAGYNAGPGRPKSWMDRFGDPRKGEIDVIDWIEHIPFRETRNYVMRVTESLPVYRARLTSITGPIHFTEELIGEVPLRRPQARPAGLGQEEASLSDAPATE
ncbi:lytic transglycosylase domain-containing protein [Cognatishimia sp. MH4019]|uniref:lytic transglycosylase domain-containing protein n=1 Tax=Cognatishimia sp. MH4019 TaxID=2854030 RepID=UPI001CD3C783|nr:lytic transglycosylase domain-containing protein [Cognatishimia sp. MH4019]